MSKAKRKHLIASLLMLSLGAYPAMASTIPVDPVVDNERGAYIYMDGAYSGNTTFDIGKVSGWGAPNYQGAIVNFYTKNDVVLNTINSALRQEYTNNTADDAGGALYNAPESLNGPGSMTVNGNAYFANNTGGRGGAVYNEGKLIFNGNTTFKENEALNSGAYQGGGAIVNVDGTVSFKDGTTVEFIGNKAENGGVGGAILNSSYLAGHNGVVDLTIVESATFSENSATSGGAIANTKGRTGSNPAEIKIANATFSNNRATTNGGAVYNETIANFTASKFEKNTSGTYGGAIKSIEGSDLTITNGTFTENKVIGNKKASYGGAIFNQGKMEVSGNFSGNEAGRGGAIYNYATAETTIKSGTVFDGNKSTYGHGSAVYTFNGLTIEDKVEFKNNEANWGGALAVELTGTSSMPDPTNTTVKIGENVLFQKNTSGKGGAAIVKRYNISRRQCNLYIFA